MAKLALVRNVTRAGVAPLRVEVCESLVCRARGLMFRRHLSRDDGLLLVHESAIHMMFVRFELAVFWLDKHLDVIDKVLAKPWRPAYFPRVRAEYVLEIHPEHWGDHEIGDQLQLAPA